jgi:hypothetical protein
LTATATWTWTPHVDAQIILVNMATTLDVAHNREELDGALTAST